MTLTDIFELQKEISQCQNPSDIQKLFDDNGEDCDIKTAELILNSTPKFTLSEQNDTFINSKLIFCPDCKNSLPDKILIYREDKNSADPPLTNTPRGYIIVREGCEGRGGKDLPGLRAAQADATGRGGAETAQEPAEPDHGPAQRHRTDAG